MHIHTLITQTSTKKRDLKLKFFAVQTTSLHESREGLNSSLAHSVSELWPSMARGAFLHT